jgi:hypothetical protein
MRKAWVVLLFLTALGRAQLTAPRIGFVSDRDGALRPVMGVSGTFLLGDPVVQSVLSAGYSGTFGFVKTESSLTILSDAINVNLPCPPGSALFSFLGSTGFVDYLSTGTIAYWDGTSLTSLALDFFPGEVIGLAQQDASHLTLAVRQRDKRVYSLVFDAATGSLQSSTQLSGVFDNVALITGQDFLYAGRQGLILHRANGTEIALESSFTGDVSFERMGADWWSVKKAGGQAFVVHTQAGRESFYQLPENAR